MFSFCLMSKWIAILIFALFMSCLADPRLPKISVDPETGHFMDPAGRVRIFHGLNSVEKHEPWYEINFRDGDLMEAMRDMGLNIIRLGNMWTGWQPESSDSINNTYVDILEEMVENLSTLGIYTLLDTHQDVLWQTHGRGYWGVPPWIKDKMNVQTHEYPWPLTEVNRWECGYFTEEIAFGFDQMYKNANGVADDFARFWRMVAERFKNFDSVIGYELMNEPFAGNVFEEGHLKILPGIAGEENLVPFYDIIQSEIRKIDDETIIFWEPTTWSYLFPIPSEYNEALLDIFKPILEKYFYSFVEIYCGELQPNVTDTKNYNFDEIKTEIRLLMEKHFDVKDGIPQLDFFKETYTRSELNSMETEPSIWGPGFTEPPGGLEYRNRSALSWHYYCWVNDWNGGSNNDPYKPFAKWFCDEFFGPMVADTADLRGMEVGGAKMLTEFGLCIPDVNFPDSQNTVECLAVMDEADKNFNSWTYWNRDVWDNEGNIKPDTAIAFARPYPMATSGIPKEITFDLWTKSFRYEYYPDLSISKQHAGEFPTEIAVPEIQYPGGSFTVILSDMVSWNIAPYNPNIIQVIHDPQIMQDGQSIFVEIQSSL